MGWETPVSPSALCPCLPLSPSSPIQPSLHSSFSASSLTTFVQPQIPILGPTPLWPLCGLLLDPPLGWQPVPEPGYSPNEQAIWLEIIVRLVILITTLKVASEEGGTLPSCWALALQEVCKQVSQDLLWP